jgi:hypothetical protein
MTYHNLARKLNDATFRPFRIRMSNGAAIDVQEPGSVIVGESSAVLPVEIATDSEGYKVVRNWKTVSISHMFEFVDLNDRESDRGRKRKGA